jgi:hypothetical protein
MGHEVLREGRPVIFYYVHPWEVDPDHPRLPMGLMRRFKCYVNLRTTQTKIQHLISEFNVATFEAFGAGHPARFANTRHESTTIQDSGLRPARVVTKHP